MKVWIQWAQSTPVDWTVTDLAANLNIIKNLPMKPEPAGGQGTVTLDNTQGWINAINVQGVLFNGYEHYGIAYDRGARIATISGWNDEPADNTWGPYGTVWTFEFPRNDPKLSAINTVQTRTVYVQAGSEYATFLTQVGIAWSPWTSFPYAPADQIRHCPWLTAEQYAAHDAVRTPHVWEEWIGG